MLSIAHDLNRLFNLVRDRIHIVNVSGHLRLEDGQRHPYDGYCYSYAAISSKHAIASVRLDGYYGGEQFYQYE